MCNTFKNKIKQKYCTRFFLGSIYGTFSIVMFSSQVILGVIFNIENKLNEKLVTKIMLNYFFIT